MKIEAPKQVEAPKHASPTDEELRKISERLRNFQHEDLSLSPLQILTIFVDEMVHFSFENADKAREAERAEKAAKTSITKHT
jgi:uncharacterized protein YbcI